MPDSSHTPARGEGLVNLILVHMCNLPKFWANIFFYVSKVMHYYLIQDQWTALHWAAWSDHVDGAKLLIAAGANKNAFDRVSIIVFFFNLNTAVHR